MAKVKARNKRQRQETEDHGEGEGEGEGAGERCLSHSGRGIPLDRAESDVVPLSLVERCLQNSPSLLHLYGFSAGSSQQPLVL